MPKTFEADLPKAAVGPERRRNKRIAIAFQIEVSGKDMTGSTFDDLATTINISPDGCQFPSERRLRVGDHLNLCLVNTEFARLTGNKFQSSEIVWVEPSRLGWTIGVKKLGGEDIWPITFPVDRKVPPEL